MGTGKERIFCGEFVADVYMNAGLLDPTTNIREYAPATFDSSRHTLLRNAKFSKEYRLIGPNSKKDKEDTKLGWASITDEDFYPKVDAKKPVQVQMYQPPKLQPATQPSTEP